ncbi:MAG: SRPBCC family protein [Gemmatimonadales bacterium]|nr:SRPBCC family protein [Gemmatimonadales bacterium]
MGVKGLVTGMALGAGLVYFLDPERGGARRLRWRDRLGPPSDPAALWRYGSRLGDIGGLEAANLIRRAQAGPGPSDVLVRAAGGALTFFGLARHGAVATAARTIGAGILAKEVGERAARRGDRRRTVDIQKTIQIDAPVARVYEFWSRYENFPLFMSNVREIEDLGGGRSRWVVSGPGGVPIEWRALLTERIPGDLIAWRSEPGSMLENAGVVRFRSEAGGTRVDLRFCYHPPAGGAGQAVTELLGADPRAKMNEDLGRLKALLEGITKSEVPSEESRPQVRDHGRG